jgi:predicted permease
MSWIEDLRFAFRVLAKRPWLTAMMMLVLAAGIGVNTTVFTLFNAVLRRSLPFPEGERLLFLESVNLKQNERGALTSYPDFADWRDASRELEGLAAYSETEFNLSDDAAAPERLSGALVTANAFRTLRVEPLLGRHFLPEEEQPGRGDAVLLSHGLWRDRYGSNPAIVGKTVRIDERPRTVVGVMPPKFRFPAEEDLWLPLAAQDDWLKRDSRRLAVFGRLAPGATRLSVQGELELIATRLQQEHPKENDGVGVRALTGNEQFNGGEIRTLFLAMLGAVGFVLLIACANVANVQLMRAADREREISIRTALGAGRWRVARQLLIESIVLSSAGGAVGLLFAVAGVRLFDLATVEQRPYFIDFHFDAVVFAYLTGVCLVTGILFGLAPVVHALRTNVNSSLKEGSRAQTGGRGARRFATAMVVGEVALSVVLLVGAGLMLRSFWNLYQMDFGVRTENRLIGSLSLPQLKYPEPADRLAFHEAVLPRLRSLPGVRGATSASALPSQGYSGRRVEIEGAPAEDPGRRPSEAMVVIGDDYFQTMEATLLQGRDFTPADRTEAPHVAIVNQSFAAKYWPARDVLGKRLKLDGGEDRGWITVVGVSPDIRQNSANEREVRPVVYRPFRQEPGAFSFFIVHAGAQPAALADSVRAAVADIDPNLPMQDVISLEERLARSRWGYSLFGSVFSLFGAIGLVMASAGLFALVADSVRRRIPEFGVRLAFGARPGQILKLIFSQAMKRVGAGVVLGLPAAYGASEMLESVLVGVGASDALTLLGVSAVLLGAALAACWLPARRALRIDPAVALRNE